jgi:hypothetical protein
MTDTDNTETPEIPIKRPRGVQKGEIRNPYHKGKLTKYPDIVPVLQINQKKVGEEIKRILCMDMHQVSSIEGNINAPAIQRMLAGVLVKAVEKNDIGRMSFLLDRAGISVPKQEEVSSVGKINLSILSVDELLALKKMVAKSEGPVTVNATATSKGTTTATTPSTATNSTTTNGGDNDSDNE